MPAAPAAARGANAVVGGVRFTHADRVFYPEAGITKLDVAQYYAAVRDWALPHLADRPLTVLRCPEGREETCFYQKHWNVNLPRAVGKVGIPEDTGKAEYLMIGEAAGLFALVQMSVLEIHPWGATAKKFENPDRVVFDLDPDVGLPWQRVVEAALALRDELREIGLESFAKTTGGKGLHVIVPLTPRLGWDEIKGFAKTLVERFAAKQPRAYTTNMSKRARADRIYLDYLRNSRGATAIGAYSPRARPGAPVATPLFWDEVEAAVRPDRFTIATVPDRLRGLSADPWENIGTIRQSLGAAIRKKLGL
jgi:bifunctional non-homologous end joining protein LigD